MHFQEHKAAIMGEAVAGKLRGGEGDRAKGFDGISVQLAPSAAASNQAENITHLTDLHGGCGSSSKVSKATLVRVWGHLTDSHTVPSVEYYLPPLGL